MRNKSLYLCNADLIECIRSILDENNCPGYPSKISIQSGLPKNDYGQTVAIVYDETSEFSATSRCLLRFSVVDAINAYCAENFQHCIVNPFTSHVAISSLRLTVDGTQVVVSRMRYSVVHSAVLYCGF